MKTFKEAADQLGVSYSSIARRVSLLKMKTETNDKRRLTVDVDELERRWQERHEQIAGPRGVNEAPLSVMIRQDQRDTIEHLAGGDHLAPIVRSLLDVGMARVDKAVEYREGRGWGPVPAAYRQP